MDHVLLRSSSTLDFKFPHISCPYPGSFHCRHFAILFSVVLRLFSRRSTPQHSAEYRMQPDKTVRTMFKIESAHRRLLLHDWRIEQGRSMQRVISTTKLPKSVRLYHTHGITGQFVVNWWTCIISNFQTTRGTITSTDTGHCAIDMAIPYIHLHCACVGRLVGRVTKTRKRPPSRLLLALLPHSLTRLKGCSLCIFGQPNRLCGCE